MSQQMKREDLLQAGEAFAVLLHSTPTEVLENLQGLEAWAASWGPRLMDTLDELLRFRAGQPDPGSRDILRLWLDKDGLLQMAIDVPREGETANESGGIADEAHFAALYQQLLTGITLLQQLHARMKGTTGVH